MAGLYNRESLICCLFDSSFLCLNLWTILHLFVKMLSQLWELFFGKVGNTAILIPFFVLLGKNWLGMRIAVFKRLNWIFLFFKRLTWYKKIYYGVHWWGTNLAYAAHCIWQTSLLYFKVHFPRCYRAIPLCHSVPRLFLECYLWLKRIGFK